MAGHGSGYSACRPSASPSASETASAVTSVGPSSARIRSVCHGRNPPSPKTSSASPGMRTAGRGTRLPLPEGETIRFFLHWRDLPEAPP